MLLRPPGEQPPTDIPSNRYVRPLHASGAEFDQEQITFSRRAFGRRGGVPIHTTFDAGPSAGGIEHRDDCIAGTGASPLSPAPASRIIASMRSYRAS
ncbi:MAG TPA: hypothetical protein VF456_07215 [Vicinamibacterales bacterium]